MGRVPHLQRLAQQGRGIANVLFLIKTVGSLMDSELFWWRIADVMVVVDGMRLKVWRDSVACLRAPLLR